MSTGCFSKKNAVKGFFIALFLAFMMAFLGSGTGTVSAQEPVKPEVKLLPPVFNTISNKKITVALIRLPRGYSVKDIDRSSLLLDEKLSPEKVFIPGKRSDFPGHFRRGHHRVKVCKNSGVEFGGQHTYFDS